MSMLLDIENCEGSLSLGEDSVELNFKLTVSMNGEIELDFKSIEFTNDTLGLLTSDTKNVYVEHLKLKANTPEGYLIRSNSVSITRSNISSSAEGVFVKSSATAAEIEIEYFDEPVEETNELILEFLIAGFRSFEPFHTNHDIGEIIIRGSSKIEDYSEISGQMQIKKNDLKREDWNSWIEKAEKQERLILDVLSFACGRYLRTNAIKHFCGKKLWQVKLYRQTSSDTSYKPPISYLNPIIEAGISNYTEDLIKQTGINIALEWHLMHSKYDENRYLCQMIALEHLLDVYRKRQPTNRLLQKSKFRQIVRPELEKTLDHLVDRICDAQLGKEDCLRIIAEFKGKIGNLNMKSLKTSLNDMLHEYDIPLDGLEEYLPHLITVRNDIVHRGIHKSSGEDKSISVYLSAVQELLKRILMSFIKYEGQYRTFFENIELKSFP